MTRRNTLLLVAVAAIAAVGAYWMLVLSPKREQATALSTQITKKEGELKAAEVQLATYQAAQAAYRDNYSLVARLGKAVPTDDDVRSLMVQISAAAKRSHVVFRTISIGGGGVAAAAPAAAGPSTGAQPGSSTPPGAAAVGSSGFSAMPFTFSFKGGFFDLSKFFDRLDRFVAVKNQGLDVTGRLLLLNSITLQPDPVKGFPQMTAEVNANSYLLPPTAGLLAESTAQGPAGTAAAKATPAPGPTTPATPAPTTATVTGATP